MLKKINYKLVRDKIPNNTCIKMELRPITYKNSKNHICWFGHHKDKDGPFREENIYFFFYSNKYTKLIIRNFGPV